MVDGTMLTSRLKKLSQVKSLNSIHNLTNYLYPGSHCPLMGATMAIGGIKDSLMVVLGTDECTYYNKSSLASGIKFGGVMGRCVSIVITAHDITFGSVETVKASFKQIIAEYKPSCVFLVTTCIIEIIGDDIDSFADDMTDTYHIPILPVHTEHFKSVDHLPGLERTMQVCIHLMEEQDVSQGVNFIGERLGDITKSEVYQFMGASNIEVGMLMPGECTLTEIKEASKAKVNIVVHDIGVPLAKEMQKKFGIPYVLFFRFMDEDRIYENYKQLYTFLDVSLPSEITDKYNETKKIIQQLAPSLDGVTYVYNTSALQNLEFNHYLCRLNMVPLMLQISKLDKQDRVFINEILLKHDPYVTKSANMVPFQRVAEHLNPTLFFGSRMMRRQTATDLTQVYSTLANSMLGFEITQHFADLIKTALETAKKKEG